MTYRGTDNGGQCSGQLCGPDLFLIDQSCEKEVRVVYVPASVRGCLVAHGEACPRHV